MSTEDPGLCQTITTGSSRVFADLPDFREGAGSLIWCPGEDWHILDNNVANSKGY
jgi:hypothetical protein